ncbi:MAG TPA: class I SAM-dependent methyltransferase [Dehalococcoidia bacterium]|nr:class I SAM-dependent methyltransferase [Dehalococcoidia bacterium]
MTPEQMSTRASRLWSSRWRRWLQSMPGQMLANTPAYGLAREMVVRPEQRVLEIGCGAGSRLLLLDQRVRFTVSAAGIEPCRQLAGAAQRAYTTASRPASAIIADPGMLPFADGVFDLALCIDLLRFLDVRGAQSVLREAARVLRPGSLLLAWDIAPPSGKLAWWQRLWTRGSAGRLASTPSLLSLAERSGFNYARDARQRPFLWPPIPRASFIAAVYPEGVVVRGDSSGGAPAAS